MLTKTHIRILVGLVLIAIISFTYAVVAGYRISEWKIIKLGTIEVTVPYADSTIYLDNIRYTKSSNDGDIITIKSLPVGLHSILVHHENRWPWMKNVETALGGSYAVKAFNLPLSSSVTIIEKNTKEYNEISSLIKQYVFPTKDKPLFSKDTMMSVYIDGNTIYATWHGEADNAPLVFCTDNTECTRTIPVLSLKDKINSLHFYPYHNDKLIIAGGTKNGGSVSVLEIDRIRNQNYQHIIVGTNPTAILNDKTLSVFDNGVIGTIELE